MNMSELPVYRILEKTGRRGSGHNGDHGKIAHAVPYAEWAALCGTTPTGAGDWSSYESPTVTCPKCLKRMEKLAATDQASS